ncbi:type-2 histone deacetylase 1-like [Portunus trituberculatus]|uniref:type-2 histone deacetylase 1-like n=1 Tax=Portunus trituberculatus TaxID=210409 RepID=UPI001E1D0C1B|nr:type-2 histone deacetylase 1-like [Portunus trituberculatus]
MRKTNKEVEDVENGQKGRGAREKRITRGRSDSLSSNNNKKHHELPATLSSVNSDLLHDSQRLKAALYNLLQATKDHPGAALHAMLLGEVDKPAGELISLLTKSFKGVDSGASRLALSGSSPSELLASGGSFVSSKRNTMISLPPGKIVSNWLPNVRGGGSFFSSNESHHEASKSRVSAPSGKNVSEDLTLTNNAPDGGSFFSSEEESFHVNSRVFAPSGKTVSKDSPLTNIPDSYHSVSSKEKDSTHIDSKTPSGKTFGTTEERRRRRRSQGVMYLPINAPRPDPCAPPKGAGLLKALPLVLLSSLLSVADAVATVVNNLNSNNNNNNNNNDNNMNSDNTNVDANINNANQINIVPFDGRRALRMVRQGMDSVGRAALDVWRAVAGDGDDDGGAEGEGNNADVGGGEMGLGNVVSGGGGGENDGDGGGGREKSYTETPPCKKRNLREYPSTISRMSSEVLQPLQHLEGSPTSMCPLKHPSFAVVSFQSCFVFM